MKKYVSTDFMKFSFNNYPALANYTNTEYRKFFMYLCFGNWKDEITNKLVLGKEVIHKLIETEVPMPYWGLHVFLSRFKKDVLPNIEFDQYNFVKGKATTVLNNGFSDELKIAILNELKLSFYDRNNKFINFGSLQEYDAAHAKANRTKEIKSALAVEAAYRESKKIINPTKLIIFQNNLIDYLHSLNPSHLFLRKYNSNHDHVDNVIEEFFNEPGADQDYKLSVYRTLRNIENQPLPIYRPTVSGNTCRVHCNNDSVVILHSTIRKAVCKGWTEADLKSSQLAILAAKIDGLPYTKSLLDNGESIWESYNTFLYGKEQPLTNKKKDIFKPLTYSIPYGKAKSRTEADHIIMLEKCKKEGTDPLKHEDIERYLKRHNISKLIDHPVIQELLTARANWYKEIDKKGGLVDAFGNQHTITKTRPAYKIGCSYIQSVEMSIMQPLFEYCKEFGEVYDFQMTIWQHDGVTLSFKNKGKKEFVMNELKTRVEAAAIKNHGVKAILEFKDL